MPGLHAVAVAEAVRAGRLDPVAEVLDCLDRIRVTAGYGAFVRVRRDPAIAEARQLRARLGAGPDEVLSLAGVPVAVKDVVAVAGEPMRAGSLATDPTPQPADHPVVARLRAAGAIIVGATATCESAMWAATEQAGRPTRSPVDPRFSAGGSSGGSAAAVGCGAVPLALGTDALGSIRIPAAACGVVGVKPGRGLVPDSGDEQETWLGLSVHGPLARTVADAALALSVLAGMPRLAVPGPVSADGVTVRVFGHTLLGGALPDPVRAAVQTAAASLRRAGARVRPADWPKSPEAVATGMAYWMAAAELTRRAAGPAPGRRDVLQRRTRVLAPVGRLCLQVAPPVSPHRWLGLAENVFGSADVVLTPVLRGPPLRAARWSQRGAIANITANLRSSGGFTQLANLVGWPAVAVPVPGGPYPSGGQLVGRADSEGLLLRLAAVVEADTGRCPGLTDSSAWTRS